MAMKEITVNPFRSSNIGKAIKELEKYKKLLEELPVKLTNAVLDKLNEHMQAEAPSGAQGLWEIAYAVDMGGKTEGLIIFDGKVEFFEFGTGIVGEQNHNGINWEWLSKLPPPYNVGWNTGIHIVHTTNGTDYWRYHDETGSHVTHGIPADPFIYRSVQQVLEERHKIMEEVLNGYGQT